MDDLARNTRTLIVCFTVALFALIPLRFVEEGQLVIARQNQVLGEIFVEEVEAEEEPIIQVDPARLEAPYNLIDGGLVSGYW